MRWRSLTTTIEEQSIKNLRNQLIKAGDKSVGIMRAGKFTTTQLDPPLNRRKEHFSWSMFGWVQDVSGPALRPFLFEMQPQVIGMIALIRALAAADALNIGRSWSWSWSREDINLQQKFLNLYNNTLK